MMGLDKVSTGHWAVLVPSDSGWEVSYTQRLPGLFMTKWSHRSEAPGRTDVVVASRYMMSSWPAGQSILILFLTHFTLLKL